MKLPQPKRINREDFDEKDKSFVDKIAYLLNDQIGQLTTAFNKNIDFDNLKQELKDVTVEVDSDGIPKILTNFKNGLIQPITGTKVINVVCLTDHSTRPIACPFITFSEIKKIVTIIHVAGLPADKKFKLTINTIV